MTNETIETWAAQMLVIINEVDDTIVGGIDGLGSQDGQYVSADVALKILAEFTENKLYSIEPYDKGEVFICPTDDYDVGLTIQLAEHAPGERVLNWFVEGM